MIRARVYQACLLFCLFASSSLAVETNCFGGFASLSPVEKEMLTARTYRQLLHDVGAAKLTAEVVDRMIKGENPFDVPEGKEDLDGLRKQLRSLQELLANNQWDSKAMRALLVDELKAYRVGQRRAEKRLRRMVHGGEEHDFEIPLEDSNATPILSPDGQWVVSWKQRLGHLSAKLVAVNVNTKQRHEKILSMDYESQPTFTPDGKGLLFPNHWAGFYFVPFQDGQANFGKSKNLFRSGESSKSVMRSAEVLPTTDPQRFFHATPEGLALFDLATGTRTPVKWKEYAPQSPDFAPHVVPGTDLLAVRALENDAVRLHIVAVDKDGNVTPAGPSHLFPEGPSTLGFAANGTAFALLDKVGLVARTATGDFRPLKSERETEFFPWPSSVVPHPIEKDVVLVFAQQKDGGNATSVEAFDLTKGKSRGANIIPHRFFHDPVFFPDGKRLMWKTTKGNARIVDSDWLVHPERP